MIFILSYLQSLTARIVPINYSMTEVVSSFFQGQLNQKILMNALLKMEDVTNYVTIRWEVTSARAGKDTECLLITELVKASLVYTFFDNMRHNLLMRGREDT